MTGDNAVRQRLELGGESFYLIVGKDFCHVTVPRENDPRQSEIRKVAEAICELVTEIQGGLGCGRE